MASDEEEDDYMSMVIEEPTLKETFTQKKRREQREAEARGRVPSKAERAAQEASRRDEALATSTLDPSNKGFKMMAKLGFKAGESLGKRDTDQPSESNSESTPRPDQARSEPLHPIFKENRGGIGLDTEKKRKIREEAEEATKKIKRDEGDYRDRVREERELRRTEAQIRSAQKVAERLDTETEEGVGGEGDKSASDGHEDNEDKSRPAEEKPKSANTSKKPIHVKPTSQINILYRGLVREREDREREKQARHVLQHSLPSSFFPSPTLPGCDDGDLEREDRKALGSGPGPYINAVEEELDEEDPELEEFNALEAPERLQKLVVHLRDMYRYCFWCKYRYETDLDLEGCPGLTEEDHD
ncbi:hypothetical protein N7478_002551 [Penicillium angulare]|uniref:uncharacterized protein n=1 Tax=Penicillium angulare TaxID=116970 RepID=UPI00253F73FB|nr:uncharacterized protein N7478_002551 [Penicillium angulare]KAJ5286865.1 hypothetical protein N7478_002551 [Penicillium angulare]